MWSDFDSILCDMVSGSEDEDCNQAMDDVEYGMDNVEEDVVCNHVMDGFDRNRDYQSGLIQQSGGAIDPNAEGRFEFVLDPFIDRQSVRMGVRERHVTTRMRQTGNFIDRPQLVPALERGLRDAMNCVLEQDMADQDRLYFTIASDRLTSNFQGYGLTAGEWRNGGDRVDALFNRMANDLNSNENFELNDSFQVSITR